MTTTAPFVEKRVVLVPTYNEKEALGNFLAAITPVMDAFPFSILFIDDNSPDGTGQLLDAHAARDSRIHVLHRAEKNGLGPAYQAGFEFALTHGAEFLVQTDCDLSHPIDMLPSVFTLLAKDADVVIGSRYIPGGRTENWPWARRMVSIGGSTYARYLLGVPLKDLTGGFNGWRAHVLRQILQRPLKSSGYSFQIELKFRAHLAGYRVQEIPITFVERRVGKSKMSFEIAREAAFKVLGWGVQRVLGCGPKKELSR